MRHILLSLGLALLIVGRAHAAPIDDAKAAFSEGKAAFERGDYDKALERYQAASRILPAPNLYYNIGTTYERLGRYQEAAMAFDQYFKMAGAPQNDDDRAFQDKLHVRAEEDRKRPNVQAPPQQPQQVTPQQPPPQFYAPNPYYGAPYPGFVPPLSREEQLKRAKGRHTRAIVLMAIGVPFAVVGITLHGYSSVIPISNGDGGLAFGLDIWAGATLFIVGTTLWAPGAASFVKSSHDINQLQLQQPQPLPPAFSGQH